MIKIRLYLILCILVLLPVGFFFSTNLKDDDIVQTIPTNPDLVVITHGSLDITSDHIYFKPYSKSISKKEFEEYIHIFEFKEALSNIELIKKIEYQKGTYIVVSPKGLNIQALIEENNLQIPFYDIITKEDIKITLFAYGGEYDRSIKEYKAIALAGNFKETDFEKQLVSFLLEKRKG